jgi:hypothetical protein
MFKRSSTHQLILLLTLPNFSWTVSLKRSTSCTLQVLGKVKALTLMQGSNPQLSINKSIIRYPTLCHARHNENNILRLLSMRNI